MPTNRMAIGLVSFLVGRCRVRQRPVERGNQNPDQRFGDPLAVVERMRDPCVDRDRVGERVDVVPPVARNEQKVARAEHLKP